MGWPVAPDAFGELLTRVGRQYQPKAIYVTENGCAFPDTLVDGRVDDPRRTAYLAGHLAALSGAIEAGSPVRGYFAWSLLDNFEWGHGYSKRFGIVYVDYPTQAADREGERALVPVADRGPPRPPLSLSRAARRTRRGRAGRRRPRR